LERRPLDGNFLSEFLPEVWPGDLDGETVTTTQNHPKETFRETEKAGEDYAPERNSADGLERNRSTIWNPSRDQWIVIWVCSLAAWLLWSADNAGGYGIFGRTAVFGDHTDHRLGALAIVIGVLLTWQLESRRKK
jgi:hypothetical protein